MSPDGTHYSIYAFESDSMNGRIFQLDQFEVHDLVNFDSPCFIDVGEHVPHPGLHVSQYAKVIGMDVGIPDIANPPPNATEEDKVTAATAVQREDNARKIGGQLISAGFLPIKAVTSASTATYPAVGTDCSDANGIPPPACTDQVSNKRRLTMCQAFWAANPTYYEGSDRILTSPLNGDTHGNVDGLNPVNMAPIGGAQFFIDEVLTGFDGYAVYQQMDGAAANAPGTQILVGGKGTMETRGVTHVHLTDPTNPTLFADMAIFADLGEDNVSF
ncbi:MAG: hypothetical protein ABJE66_02995 [Deltaproteobacteria bacterium]